MIYLMPALMLSLLFSVTYTQALTVPQEDIIAVNNDVKTDCENTGKDNVQASRWTPEDTTEVRNHWDPYLKNQDEKGEYSDYIAVLLDIKEDDAHVASHIAVFALEQDAFKKFVEKKDLDTTLGLIEYITRVLQRTVWDECALRFPPQLADFAQDMEKSGLSQEEYLTKVRRAFLAFTIIVSCMDQVINLEQIG